MERKKSWGWLTPFVLAVIVVILVVLEGASGRTTRAVLRHVTVVDTWGSQGNLSALNDTLFSTLQAQLKGLQQLGTRLDALERGMNSTNAQLGETQREMHSQKSRIAALNKRLNSTEVAIAELPAHSEQGEHCCAMAIVEPRDHPKLQYVLENFDAHMPLTYDLYIFHGLSRGEFAKASAKKVALHRRVVYIPADVNEGNGDWYNRLLKSPERFWNLIHAQRVLTFQTDSVLCGGSPWTIHDFEHMAYIGCAYDHKAGFGSKMWGGNPFWGNGGVTLHSKSRALECIAQKPHKDLPEDVLFSQCVQEGWGRHAESGTHLAEFCTTLGPATRFTARSFAAHKIHNRMKGSTGVELFLAYCPEARPLMDPS